MTDTLGQRGLLITPLRCVHEDTGTLHCSCVACVSGKQSTWTLSYYVTHGLNVGGSAYRSLVKIDSEMVAQAFHILSQRVRRINKVMSLQEEAAFRVFSLAPTAQMIDQLPLPAALKKELTDIFPLLTDTIDRDLWRESPSTMFTISSFPQFLLRHIGKFLKVRSAHFTTGLHDLDWFSPPRFLL